MDAKKTAQQVLDQVGGAENVTFLTHCVTRLRFNLKSMDGVDEAKVKAVPGVVGVVNKGGQYQVIIGNEVAAVYDELMKLGDFGGKEVKQLAAPAEEKKSRVSIILDTLAGVFTPLMPLIAGAGMIKAILSVLSQFGVLSTDSQTYQLFYLVADGVFYYMPFFLAFSAGKKFKCNPYLSLIFAAMLVHPNYIALRTAGEAVKLFGFLPVTLASYTSSVVPIILIVYFQSIVERFFEKKTPKAIKVFFVPMITILVTVPVGYVVLGPLGSIVGSYLAKAFTALDVYAGWLVPTLVGGLCPLLVMTGMHYALGSAQSIQRATMGYATILAPGMVCSNMAQSAATFGVALKSKNPDIKSLASTVGVTALCGITEPTLYGIGLKYKTPLYSAMAGGALGGLYAGIMHVKQWAYGTSTIFALPVYLGEDNSFLHICIAVAIAMLSALIISYITFKDPVQEK